GPVLSQQFCQQRMGSTVTGVLELLPGQPGLADGEKPLARGPSQPVSQVVVVGVGRQVGVAHASDPSLPAPSPTQEQSAFGSVGSASFCLHLQGLNDVKVTVVQVLPEFTTEKQTSAVVFALLVLCRITTTFWPPLAVVDTARVVDGPT